MYDRKRLVIHFRNVPCCVSAAGDNRKTQGNFKCKKYGFEINADLNASRNIRDLGLASYIEANVGAINLPNVSEGHAHSA